MPPGYYRITEVPNETGQRYSGDDPDGYIISLPMQDPADPTQTLKTINVYPKNITNPGPVIEKEEPDIDDLDGNILHWTIRAEVPASLKKTKGDQTYEITDTMGTGLTYAGNLQAYYVDASDSNVDFAPATSFDVSASIGGNSLKLTLKEDGYSTLGAAVKNKAIKKFDDKQILFITYDTVVDIDKAVFQVSPENEVELVFVNEDGTRYADKTNPPVTVEELERV